MLNIFKNFLREEEGQDLVEYALLLALITLAAVGILLTTGESLTTIWTNVEGQLSSAPTGGS